MISRKIRRGIAWPRNWQAGTEWWRRITPPQLFVGSFLGLIAFGTLGLMTIPGLYTGPGLGFVDALFTATSAVCVTGLVVVDTGTYFTRAGQAFLLLLIQLGGLGFITLTTLIILALGRRLSLRQERVAGAGTELSPAVNVRGLTRDVVRFTLLFEALGAALLYLAWAPGMGVTAAIWPAVFHAVSAFCNAGFSIFADSLVGTRLQVLPMFTIMCLIVVGGLGFLTMEELYLRRKSRRMRHRRVTDELVPRLSLHSRLVLVTTAILIGVGAVFFTIYEWHLSFAMLPAWARPMNGLFMAVTARTAGFNTIDYAATADGTSFLTILLMFIGGSPGSMAGGVKTTTIAVIGLLALSRLRGSTRTSAFGRTVPEETVQRAVGLFVVAFGIVTMAIFLFTTTELGAVPHNAVQGEFLRLMFEAVSAFSTVGLSMGMTDELTTTGRLLTTLLMYIGRVGPLTFAAAIAMRPDRRGDFRYAHEDVVIG
ncbi:MAG TPA: potassium transporter TrkG [Longimicrobiales bacterium]|nr:potassium transporter TrkG [Longimicrobiales bacterium]